MRASTSLSGHQGHAHRYLGTVTMLHADGSFMMDTTEGKDVTVKTAANTVYTKTDGSTATREDLAVGARVVVKMMTDGQTAASVWAPCRRSDRMRRLQTMIAASLSQIPTTRPRCTRMSWHLRHGTWGG